VGERVGLWSRHHQRCLIGGGVDPVGRPILLAAGLLLLLFLLVGLLVGLVGSRGACSWQGQGGGSCQEAAGQQGRCRRVASQQAGCLVFVLMARKDEQRLVVLQHAHPLASIYGLQLVYVGERGGSGSKGVAARKLQGLLQGLLLLPRALRPDRLVLPQLLLLLLGEPKHLLLLLLLLLLQGALELLLLLLLQRKVQLVLLGLLLRRELLLLLLLLPLGRQWWPCWGYGG